MTDRTIKLGEYHKMLPIHYVGKVTKAEFREIEVTEKRQKYPLLRLTWLRGLLSESYAGFKGKKLHITIDVIDDEVDT